jgi:hypothetical protein
MPLIWLGTFVGEDDSEERLSVEELFRGEAMGDGITVCISGSERGGICRGGFTGDKGLGGDGIVRNEVSLGGRVVIVA